MCPASLFEEQGLKFFNNKEMTKVALHYIEMYANPVKMAMADLESGRIQDPSIINLISDLVVSENSHRKEII